MLASDTTVVGTAHGPPRARAADARDTTAGVTKRLPGRDVVPATVVESDALLCQLTYLRQTLVLPQARAAASLHAHAAWLFWGPSNADDFCRDGFQRTGRWLRDLVRLHAATARLPALGAAVAGADGRWPVGQMAALAIARVATEADVASWIERARQIGLHSLRQEVTAALEARGEVPGERPEEEPHVEQRVLWALAVPPEVALAHEAARDLHRAFVGRETGLGGFAEAVIGEVGCLGWTRPEDYRPRFLAPDEPVAVDGWRRPATTLLGRADGVSVHDRSAWVEGLSASGTPGIRQALEVIAAFEKLAARQARLLRALDRTTRGVQPRTRRLRRLVAVLRQLVRLENRLEIAVGDLSLELHEGRAWRLLGYGGLEAYAEERLGMAGSTARERVSLARQLRRFPALRQAYESGRIGMEKARLLARVLRDRPGADAAAWIEAAARTKVRRLRQEERWLRREVLQARAAVAASMTPGAGDGGAESAGRFPLRHEPVDDATWRGSLRRVPGETRARIFRWGLDLMERVVHAGPLLPVTLRLFLPADQAVDLRGCVEAARRELAAQPQRTPAEECRLWPSQRIANAFVARGERVPEWVGYLAVLETCSAEWDEPKRSPKHDPVVERDGCHCMAPGCTRQTDLQRHHLSHRSWGGGDEEDNQLLLCVTHHMLGEHGGLARCRGRAPLDVVWRLGCEEFATWWRNDKQLDGPP